MADASQMRRKLSQDTYGSSVKAYATELAVGGEAVAASCQYLVAVGLMAHVPYNSILGGVEDIVQCHCYLGHAQARGQMARIDRQFIDDA